MSSFLPYDHKKRKFLHADPGVKAKKKSEMLNYISSRILAMSLPTSVVVFEPPMS